MAKRISTSGVASYGALGHVPPRLPNPGDATDQHTSHSQTLPLHVDHCDLPLCVLDSRPEAAGPQPADEFSRVHLEHNDSRCRRHGRSTLQLRRHLSATPQRQRTSVIHTDAAFFIVS